MTSLSKSELEGRRPREIVSVPQNQFSPALVKFDGGVWSSLRQRAIEKGRKGGE